MDTVSEQLVYEMGDPSDCIIPGVTRLVGGCLAGRMSLGHTSLATLDLIHWSDPS
jgi:hypothetical protein